MALSPYTFNNLPAVRPLPKPRPWPAWVYDRKMEQARAMFAYYKTPMRPWPAPAKAIDDLIVGRLLWEAEWKREDKQERAAVLAMLKRRQKHISDRPRIIPFKGECLKRAWQRFNLWRSKRQAWHELDWFNRHPL